MGGQDFNILLRQGEAQRLSRARRAGLAGREEAGLHHRHHGDEMGEDGPILVPEASTSRPEDEKEEG